MASSLVKGALVLGPARGSSPGQMAITPPACLCFMGMRFLGIVLLKTPQVVYSGKQQSLQPVREDFTVALWPLVTDACITLPFVGICSSFSVWRTSLGTRVAVSAGCATGPLARSSGWKSSLLLPFCAPFLNIKTLKSSSLLQALPAWCTPSSAKARLKDTWTWIFLLVCPTYYPSVLLSILFPTCLGGSDLCSVLISQVSPAWAGHCFSFLSEMSGLTLLEFSLARSLHPRPWYPLRRGAAVFSFRSALSTWAGKKPKPHGEGLVFQWCPLFCVTPAELGSSPAVSWLQGSMLLLL